MRENLPSRNTQRTRNPRKPTAARGDRREPLPQRAALCPFLSLLGHVTKAEDTRAIPALEAKA